MSENMLFDFFWIDSSPLIERLSDSSPTHPPFLVPSPASGSFACSSCTFESAWLYLRMVIGFSPSASISFSAACPLSLASSSWPRSVVSSESVHTEVVNTMRSASRCTSLFPTGSISSSQNLSSDGLSDFSVMNQPPLPTLSTCWPQSLMYLAVEVAALATLMEPAGPTSVIGGQSDGRAAFSKATSRSSIRRVPDAPQSRSLMAANM
mmetsp:Transcript_81755/g.231803  ORF Transcript_81755/g.231803 Transcript_81755/m.231803 type:complete len:208 (-) Transcript_81755:536-1159(-)